MKFFLAQSEETKIRSSPGVKGKETIYEAECPLLPPLLQALTPLDSLPRMQEAHGQPEITRGENLASKLRLEEADSWTLWLV